MHLDLASESKATNESGDCNLLSKQTVRALQITEAADAFQSKGKTEPRFSPEPQVILCEICGHATAIPDVVHTRMTVEQSGGLKIIAQRHAG